jgi:BirA family biotin operon repressor/biotin-[acetyl-CoA-carboxylase] ligase
MAYTLHLLESCESTNDIAMQLVREGCPDRSVVITKIQTKGKGRAGRQWNAWPGSLTFSVALRPKQDSSTAPLAFVAAVAVTRALIDLGVNALIKWPNDIVVKGSYEPVEKLGCYRKLGGILVEATSTNNQTNAAVIGIGLNLTRPPASFEGTLLPQMGFIHDLQPAITNEHLLEVTLSALDQVLLLPAPLVITEAKLHSAILGKKVWVDLGETTIEGTAIDIAEDGSLIVDDGEQRRVFFGDVSLALTDA